MKPLAIVGSHPKTRKNAPWNDDKWDIWVIGDAVHKGAVKRCDGLIQIHDPEVYKEVDYPEPVRGGWGWLKRPRPYPIWMQEVDPEVPGSEKFPLEEIIQDLLPNVKQGAKDLEQFKPFTSSIAMLVALGIWQGRKRIAVYGAEMEAYEEYATQREMFTFWLGYAAGRGVELTIHCMDGVLRNPIYGYETNQRRIMELAVWERIHLLNILPREGDLITIKLCRKLREDLSFSADEITTMEIVQDGDTVTWNKEKEVTKEVEIGEVGRKMIANAFKALDQNQKFTEEMLFLYERMVEQKEELPK